MFLIIPKLGHGSDAIVGLNIQTEIIPKPLLLFWGSKRVNRVKSPD
jgi:hypothetical protein